jgi:hypothetical protein
MGRLPYFNSKLSIPTGHIPSNGSDWGKLMVSLRARIGAIREAVMRGQRKVHRSRVHARALVTSSRGDSAAMIIANVSTHGCNVRGEAGWLRIGSFVGVALEDKPMLHAPMILAIVRWTREDAAGLEFMRPVSPGNKPWNDLINSRSDR